MDRKLPGDSCTGCGACMQTCKFEAILMQPQADGFLYPVIDENRCVQCGQCVSVCHALGDNELHRPTACYAAQLEDRDVLLKSSSGGLFSALAAVALKTDGIVYGCAYDEDYNAVIVRAETQEQLEPFRGSKYVWSDPSGSYPLVKQDLEDGRTVLYTCLPCQAAGLRKYLRKDYENLIIADVLCGGSPSPFAFQKYLETLTDREGRKTLNFQFRDKDKTGAGVNCTYVLNGRKHFENWLENSFYFSFCSQSRISWRKSCYNCDYKSVSRVSDITIGDYWGVEKKHSEYKPRDGVSVVLVNTGKGAALLEKVKPGIRCTLSDVETVTEKNSLVMNAEDGHVPIPAQRDAFFAVLQSEGWDSVDRRFLSRRKKMLRKQKWRGFLRRIRHPFR